MFLDRLKNLFGINRFKKKRTKEEIEEIKSKIHPPAYVPTEWEIQNAYLRWVLDDIFYDTLLCLNMVRTGRMEDANTEEQQRNGRLPTKTAECFKEIDGWFEKWHEKGNEEIWEVIHPYEEWKTDWLGHLADQHCGDCTCVPATCMRCYAESLFKIPHTQTWEKHEGWRLLNEFNAIMDEEESGPPEN